MEKELTITSQIDRILDRRLGRGEHEGKGRLQQIEDQMESLDKVKKAVDNLAELKGKIQSQLEAKSGPYYTLFKADPEAESNFNRIKCSDAQEAIKAAGAELELLKKRFERKALRFAFIGVERQGKSTFLKTISGLNDKVIPAYSGNSCTGAVSVIHNTDEPFRVEVEYYSEAEFLKIVNEKLESYFPDHRYRVATLSQIGDLKLPEILDSGSEAANKLSNEYKKFKDSVVEHFKDYRDLIGQGVQTYYDEDEVAQHVAQYEEFPTQVEGSVKDTKDDETVVYKKPYYKYVAVKAVDIYKQFAVEDTGKLELVDTIGIGSTADNESIKNEMFRVLREDCDAAIDLFRADKTPNLPAQQSILLDEIKKQMAGREPSKWVVYVLNKVVDGMFKNEQSTRNVFPHAKNFEKTNTVAWVKAIDGSNFDEVKDELVLPLINLVMTNLDYLDEKMMDKAAKLCEKAYYECMDLLSSSEEVLSSSIEQSADALEMFDEKLFPALEKSFNAAMIQLDTFGYETRREQKCSELAKAYEKASESIIKYLPKKDEIYTRFMTEAVLTPEQVFNDYAEQWRNKIFNEFEEVNTTVLYPLQEKVKKDIMAILFNQGLFDHFYTENEVPQKTMVDDDDNVTKVADPSPAWLREFIDRYVDEKKYPALSAALNFVLDYQISIEGMVEYNVTKSLYIIDQTHRDFIRYNRPYEADYKKRAENVRNELVNRLEQLTDNLKSWIDDFALIPSHSFYSRVHKFRMKLTSDERGKRDFRAFYRKNMSSIWYQELSSAEKSQKAFGEWSNRVGDLKRVANKIKFKTQK